MWHRRFIDDAEHELRRRRICGKEIVRLQKIACYRISHRETDCRDSFAAENIQEVVIAAAACHRTFILTGGIEDFEDHAGVIIETARYLRVDDHIAYAH